MLFLNCFHLQRSPGTTFSRREGKPLSRIFTPEPEARGSLFSKRDFPTIGGTG
jgi:hypothetical protein